MEADLTITRARMDALLAYREALSKPGRTYLQGVGGGEVIDERTVSALYPIYDEDVVAFFMEAGRPWWADTAYVPRIAHRMLWDDACIARATLGELRTMLTYCVRGERFSDGHWHTVLVEGRVERLLDRLAALRAAL